MEPIPNDCLLRSIYIYIGVPPRQWGELDRRMLRDGAVTKDGFVNHEKTARVLSDVLRCDIQYIGFDPSTNVHICGHRLNDITHFQIEEYGNVVFSTRTSRSDWIHQEFIGYRDYIRR